MTMNSAMSRHPLLKWSGLLRPLTRWPTWREEAGSKHKAAYPSQDAEEVIYRMPFNKTCYKAEISFWGLAVIHLFKSVIHLVQRKTCIFIVCLHWFRCVCIYNQTAQSTCSNSQNHDLWTIIIFFAFLSNFESIQIESIAAHFTLLILCRVASKPSLNQNLN